MIRVQDYDELLEVAYLLAHTPKPQVPGMINDPRMGTLVVASAGADAQAEQVVAQRDRTEKGVVFLWTGSRDATAGLARLRHARIPIFFTPDKLARGLQSRLAYHSWRERRLADGFAASCGAVRGGAVAKPSARRRSRHV